MNGFTRNLAEFCASLEFRKIPAEAVATAKRGFIDCVGVIFAGREEPVVRLLLDEKIFSEKNEARILFDQGFSSSPRGSRRRASPPRRIPSSIAAVS